MIQKTYFPTKTNFAKKLTFKGTHFSLPARRTGPPLPPRLKYICFALVTSNESLGSLARAPFYQRIALSNKFIPCPAVAVQHVRHFLESGRRIAGRRLNAQKIKARTQKQTQPLKKERTFEKGS